MVKTKSQSKEVIILIVIINLFKNNKAPKNIEFKIINNNSITTQTTISNTNKIITTSIDPKVLIISFTNKISNQA